MFKWKGNKLINPHRNVERQLSKHCQCVCMFNSIASRDCAPVVTYVTESCQFFTTALVHLLHLQVHKLGFAFFSPNDKKTDDLWLLIII